MYLMIGFVLILLSLMCLYFYLNYNKDNFKEKIENNNSINFENSKHIGWLQTKIPFNNLILYFDILNKKYFAIKNNNNEKIELDIESANENEEILINNEKYYIELEEQIE